ncbi:MAG: methylenetetrahydrofolate reductase [Candidatus Brocadiia bacterium]
MSRLQDALEAGQFVVTGEIGPPKGIDTHEMDEEIEHLRGKVLAINVTDIQSSVMRLGSLAVSEHLARQDLEPVFQMTCRDRNRLALQSDLLSAAWVGIENVLALTGDHQFLGDHPEAKGVFDLDSVSLLQTIAGLMKGRDLAGNELAGIPRFYPGAVVAPGLDPVEPQLLKMEKKIEAGAKFFQTQAVYDPRQFEQFMKRAEGFGIPVLVGIVLLKSAGMARFMNKNVAGVFVPDHLIKEMAEAKKKERKAKSAEIAGRLIKEMKDMCQGVHLMPLGWTDTIDDVLGYAGLA